VIQTGIKLVVMLFASLGLPTQELTAASCQDKY